MGGGSFVPKQRNWKWFTDATPDTSMSQLANENTKPTLANNNDIIRLRVCIAETGDKADTDYTISVQYDTNSGFTSPQSFGAAPQHWNYANGAATEGNVAGNLLLSDTATLNEYCESGANSVAIAKSSTNEIDIAIVPTASVSATTTYYFRVLGDGTAIPLDTGETYPQVLTAAAGVDVTVSAGLCSGAGSMQSSTQAFGSTLGMGLVSVGGTPFSAVNVFGSTIAAGLVSGAGSPFAVTVSIGTPVTVSVGLVDGTGTTFATQVDLSSVLSMGLATGAGAAQSVSFTLDQIFSVGVVDVSASVYSTTELFDYIFAVGTMVALGASLSATVTTGGSEFNPDEWKAYIERARMYLESLGYKGTWYEKIMMWLDDQGVPQGTYADRWKFYTDSLGYQGTLVDRRKEWAKTGTVAAQSLWRRFF